jgi:hypothetical protein
MRLWTIHPRYLDARGIVALWREALLAQKVLAGKTRGYRHHPQLARFQTQKRPVAALAVYLAAVLIEADARCYTFDGSKIRRSRMKGTIAETEGQLLYEWRHLKRKLRARDHKKYLQVRSIRTPEPHPLFHIIPGRVREWERVKK